jgi:sugar phosphate isomerase/epimerase
MMTKHSRRLFLKNSLSAAALFTTGCGEKSLFTTSDCLIGSKMKFGLVTYLWGRDWTLPTLIANCEKTNILGVELRTEHAHGVEPSLTRQQRLEVKKRFSDSPVTLIGLGRNECFDSPNPDILKKNIEATRAVIKLSSDIGATGVKVKPNDFHENVPREKTIEQIGRALNTVGRFAADYNQQVRLEVHGSCCHLPTIRLIMDIAYHPNVTVCWNSNNEDLQGRGLEFNFNLVKDRFGDTAHVRELNIGTYPYQQLINLFVGIDYTGWVLLEARTDPPDRVKALILQRQVFEQMRTNAQKSFKT